MKNTSNYGLFFRAIRFLVRIFLPKYQVKLPENRNESVVYISHHQNLFGPFITLLWFPKMTHVWLLNVFLKQSSCYRQYADYTFTERFGWNKLAARFAAWPISHFVTTLLRSARCIPVFRNSRAIIKTFRYSLEALDRGVSITIFPDVDYASASSNVTKMYDGFLHLEKYYNKKTGRHLCFVPLYASKNQRQIIATEKIYFRDGVDFKTERKRVLHEIKNNLNELAKKCGDI